MRAVRQPARRRAGLPAAVVPVPAGARPSRPGTPPPASARWSTCWPTTVPAPGADLAELTDHLDTVWASSTSTPTGCRRSSGWRPSRPWSGSSPGRRPGPSSELLGTEVAFCCVVDLGDGAGPADRQRRPGRARPRRPDPDRRLQDRPGRRRPPPTSPCTTSSGSTSWRCSRARSPSWPVPVARPGGRRAGLPPAVRRHRRAIPKVFQPGLAGRRAVPADVPRRAGPRIAATCRADLGAPAARRRGRSSSAPSGTTPGSGPACRYCPFRGSCPAQPAGRQVVAMTVHVPEPVRTGRRAVFSAHRAIWSRPSASRSPTSSWTRSPRRWSPG